MYKPEHLVPLINRADKQRRVVSKFHAYFELNGKVYFPRSRTIIKQISGLILRARTHLAKEAGSV